MTFRRIAALATGETFGRGMAWLTVFLLPWLLAEREYGIVVLLATFEGVATGFLLFGQDSAIFWRCASREDSEDARSAALGAMIVTGSACLAGLAVCTVFAFRPGSMIFGVPVWPHLWMLAVGVTLGNLNRIALAFARASGRTREFVLDRGAVGAGRLGVTLGGAAASGSALSYPIGMIVGIAMGGLWLIRSFLAGGRRLRGAIGEIGPLIRFGGPLSIHLLAMNTINMVDRWVIGAMLGLAAVGSYGWYYMVGSGVVFAYAALSVSYEPQIYREYQADAATRSLREYLGVSLAAAGVYGLAGCAAFLLAADLVPDTIRPEPAIAAIVLVAHWFRPFYLGANYLLSSVGRTMRVASISGVALVAAVAANLVLVPAIGVLGGAWATLIGMIVLVIAGLATLRRLSMPVGVLLGPGLVVGAVSGVLLARLSLPTFAAGSAVLVLYGTWLTGLHERTFARHPAASGDSLP